MALRRPLAYHPDASAHGRLEVPLSPTRALILTGSPRPFWMPALALSAEAAPTEAVTADDDAVRGALLRARRAGCGAVTLTGGEVLARAETLEWIALAVELGFRAVEVRTAGGALARPEVAAHLVRAGVTHLSVPLLGDRASAHDHLRGQEGAFALALRGLRAARKAGASARVLAPLLRPTCHALPSLVRRSLALGVAGFEFISVPGRDRPAHPLLPHPGVAAPQLRAAIAVARAARRRSRTWLVPLCQLGDEVGSALEGRTPPLVLDASAPHAPLNQSVFERQHAPACERCAWSASCGGPLRAQLERYGEGWLTARTDSPPQAGEARGPMRGPAADRA